MDRSRFAYYLHMAHAVSEAATCDLAHVGCVIVSPDDVVVSTGYNDAPRNTLGCDKLGHELDATGRCQRTIHAEQMAIAHAARKGASVKGATAYVNRNPCKNCAKLLIEAGIIRVVVEECDNGIEGLRLLADSERTVVIYNSRG